MNNLNVRRILIIYLYYKAFFYINNINILIDKININL